MTDHSRILTGLLGPPGAPEHDIGCEVCFERLDAYVEAVVAGRDGEEVVPGMAQHLAGCAACKEDFDSLRDFVSAQP
jgi:hypothetical protein